MLLTVLMLATFGQDTDVKPTAPLLLRSQLPQARYQFPEAKDVAGPIVISAIRTYEPVVLLVRDPYRCRDLEIATQIPSDKVVYATTPMGVRISEHSGLFATKTTFDFGGYKRTIHVHKNGKVVID